MQIRVMKARNFARYFAAAMLENVEVFWQENSGLTDDELAEAQLEMKRIADRISATIRPSSDNEN